jgi:hypothetical protein
MHSPRSLITAEAASMRREASLSRFQYRSWKRQWLVTMENSRNPTFLAQPSPSDMTPTRIGPVPPHKWATAVTLEVSMQPFRSPGRSVPERFELAVAALLDEASWITADAPLITDVFTAIPKGFSLVAMNRSGLSVHPNPSGAIQGRLRSFSLERP